MITKPRALWYVGFLFLGLILQPSAASVPAGVTHSSDELEATTTVHSIDNKYIRGNVGTPNGARHLDDKEGHPHKRKSKPFFTVLLAGLLVNVVTLITLLSLIPVLMNTRWSCFKSMFWVANSLIRAPTEITKKYMTLGRSSLSIVIPQHAKNQSSTALSDLFVPSIACGAILATALFLVIPEAILFIQRGTSSQSGEIEIVPGTISRFGAALMMGYMIPLVLGALFPRSSEHVKNIERESLQGQAEKGSQKPFSPVKKAKIDESSDEENIESLAATSGETEDSITANESEKKVSSIVGEIGNDSSFEENPDAIKKETKEINNDSEEESTEDEGSSSINMRMAINILVGDAVYNFFDGIYIAVAFMTCSNAIAVCVTMITIYTEVSQEMADYFLLTKCAGISIPRALLLNFSAGLAVVVGALLVLSANLGDLAIGVLLSFAAGVYLHISASECLPRVYSVARVSKDRWYSVLFFIIGALPIGLTLVNHGHCDAEE